MIDPYWFQKKWGIKIEPQANQIADKIKELEAKIQELEQRIQVLEEENVGTTNELYRMENSIDARIDILAEKCKINYDV